MLTREQLHAFLCMRNRKGTLFFSWQKDLIFYMGEVSTHGAFNKDSGIAVLLHHIVYGDLQSAKAMLELNPRLVLQAGHVVTPSGLKVVHTTPFECALGAGDPEMAQMIAPYFDSKIISGGAAVREKQYARYRPCIDNMPKQKSYDFTLLLHAIEQASPQDVAAALHNDLRHQSALSDALEQFRKAFIPDKITVGMHFNYQHLLHAYEVYDQEYDRLRNGDNFSKNYLFCRQVIGFIQRSLPAIDRMVFAQSLYDVVEQEVEIQRSFKFKYDNSNFPDTSSGFTSHSGLGFEYFAMGKGSAPLGMLAGGRARFTLVGRFLSRKNLELAELMQPQQKEKTSRCVIC
jgi:hypothetical protein